jgi:hypothetical protein
MQPERTRKKENGSACGRQGPMAGLLMYGGLRAKSVFHRADYKRGPKMIIQVPEGLSSLFKKDNIKADQK